MNIFLSFNFLHNFALIITIVTIATIGHDEQIGNILVIWCEYVWRDIHQIFELRGAWLVDGCLEGKLDHSFGESFVEFAIGNKNFHLTLDFPQDVFDAKNQVHIQVFFLEDFGKSEVR